MRKFPSPNDHRKISDTTDATYYGAGIPRVAWSTPRAKPKFVPIMGGDDDPEVKVGVKVQEDWFPKILAGEMFEDPYVVFLGTLAPNDELACRYAYEVMKAALRKDLRVQITNAARIDKEQVDGETVFMLHNVFKEANNYRLQCIRDWLTVHEDCFRIVVMAGLDPYQLSKLVHIEPHGMFLLESPAKVNNSEPKKVNRA